MFDKQYRFYGSHAEKVNALTAIFDEEAKAKLFDRNLDVYINAPLIGFLYNRKGKRDDKGDVSPQNIFPEQMINASDKLKYNLRLILLLDKNFEPDESKRLDKAFRHFGSDEDLALFDEYVLGGVEVLYEKLISGVNNTTTYTDKLYDFIEEFNERFNTELSNETILELCREKNS